MRSMRIKFSPEFRERAVRMVDEHPGELSIGVGGDDLDRREGWPHDRDVAPLVPRGGEPTSGASEVIGILRSVVGSKQVAAEARAFRFVWPGYK